MPVPPDDPSSPHRRGRSPGVDPNTDPGRPHPYESLYRAAPGDPEPPSRPTPRHFEQHLSRPDGAQEGFGWLYRAEPESADAGPDAAEPEVAGPAIVARPSSTSPAAPPPSGAPGQRSRVRRGLVIALVVLVICGLAGVAVGVGLSRQQPERFGGTPSSSAPNSPVSASDLPLAVLVPTAAAASCQAPAATDDAGRPVSYEPGNLYDGRPDTAWRCAGDGVGQSVTFTFAAGTTISEVGLINGYAKVDPTSGAHRYPEYRRVTQVTWTFPDGTAVDQTLVDGNELTQSMTIPAQSTTQVRLTIDTTTVPGTTQSTRNAMLISDVTFAG